MSGDNYPRQYVLLNAETRRLYQSNLREIAAKRRRQSERFYADAAAKERVANDPYWPAILCIRPPTPVNSREIQLPAALQERVQMAT